MLTRRSMLLGAMQARRPNVLFVMMDDLGYAATGRFGNVHVATPHLDKLAAEGMRFTQAYVTPQCTPTRATLLTGQYTARNKQWHVVPGYGYPFARVQEPAFRNSMPRDAFLLSKGLRQAGYATACIGKWHLTVNSDGNYVGLNAAAATHYGFDRVQQPAKEASQHNGGDKDVDRFTDEALQFIQEAKGRPWFCYLPHHSIHRVVSAPAPLVAKYRAKGYPDKGWNNAMYLAAMEHYDAAMGRLLAGLRDAGEEENTLVVFTSDNGGIERTYIPKPKPVKAGEVVRLEEGEPSFSNAPLRSGKGCSYEGGIRVPMIARWPRRMRANAVCHTPVHAVDFLPTFLAAAGASAPKEHIVDGVNLMPLFGGGSIAKRPLYWYHPFYDVRWLCTPNAVVREGDWKLIEFFGDYLDEAKGAEYLVGRRLELYNLKDDVGEKTNLATRMPKKAEAMSAQLRRWIIGTGATVPGWNERYDATRPLHEERRAVDPLLG